MMKNKTSRVQSTEYRVQRGGVVLSIVLLALLLLSTFGLYLGSGVRQKIILLKRLSERNNLRLIAEAGIKKALLQLYKDDTPLLDSFVEEPLNSQT